MVRNQATYLFILSNLKLIIKQFIALWVGLTSIQGKKDTALPKERNK